jgi:hypothetical protein
MSPRLKLRTVATPLVMAGTLWATSAFTPATLGAGHGPIVNRGGAQTPPPCSPDGVCIPRPQTFGWYQTRWRTFPGDVAVTAPTPAEAAADRQQRELSGPQPPKPTEEGQMGPSPTRRPGEPLAPGEGEEPGDAGEAGLGTLPGESPLEGLDLPGVVPPAAAPADGAAPQPEGQPGADPLDPFGPSGAAPPKPPAWITQAAAQRAALHQSAFPSLPVVEHAAVIEEPSTTSAPVLPGEAPNAPLVVPAAAAQPAAAPVVQPPMQVNMPAMGGPNVHGDDAPPALPPALMNQVSPASAAKPVATPTSIQQPSSVRPVVIDDQVEAASMAQPIGIHLINPAMAEVDPMAEGLQQAIYFEASDQ